jgi:hypothetical protein
MKFPAPPRPDFA